jgi:tRNA threonylcarbamoyladenosine biosynthesis protein TsaE
MKANSATKSNKEFHLKSLNDIDAVAQDILDSFPNYKVFTLVGNLGAGKTTLTQAFCKYLKVDDEVVSPTYTLINEYICTNGQSIFHADLYRINTLQEAIDTGIEDYLYSGNYCFVEWPQLITPVLPYKFVNLEIEPTADGSRKIIATPNG